MVKKGWFPVIEPQPVNFVDKLCDFIRDKT